MSESFGEEATERLKVILVAWIDFHLFESFPGLRHVDDVAAGSDDGRPVLDLSNFKRLQRRLAFFLAALFSRTSVKIKLLTTMPATTSSGSV